METADHEEAEADANAAVPPQQAPAKTKNLHGSKSEICTYFKLDKDSDESSVRLLYDSKLCPESYEIPQT